MTIECSDFMGLLLSKSETLIFITFFSFLACIFYLDFLYIYVNDKE